MLYLRDRPEAKIIARLTAAAPLEREHGSVSGRRRARFGIDRFAVFGNEIPGFPI
jgi:hypothetical protein